MDKSLWICSHCYPLCLSALSFLSLPELERSFLEHVCCRIQCIGLSECRLIWMNNCKPCKRWKRMMLTRDPGGGGTEGGWPHR